MKTRLIMLITIIALLIVSGAALAQGQEMVWICQPKGNGEWHPIQVSINSWNNGNGHPIGTFLIDDDHPCPPVESPDPQPQYITKSFLPFVPRTLSFFPPFWIP